MAKRVLNVTLAITIDTNDVTPGNNNIQVNETEIVDYFEVY